jgi:hypothetical protein
VNTHAFVAATIFLVSWGLTTHGKYSVTGDEPHYLLIAESLRSDGDLDLDNNYARGDAARFGAAGLEPELHARRSRTGQLISVHDLGVPVVLLPAYVVATSAAKLPTETLLTRFHMNRGLFAYSLLSLVIIAIVTWAAVVTCGALEDQGMSRRMAAGMVLVAWLTVPVLSNSFVVFPEPFALLAAAGAVALWASRSPRWRWKDSAAVLVLGCLPWFHKKFLLFGIGLLLVALWRRRDSLKSLSHTQKAAVGALFAIPPLALGLWTMYVWGNLTGGQTLERLPFSWSAFGHGIVGLFLDRESGLVWWAPVYALLPAAWWLRRDLAVWLIPVVALVIPCAAHDLWWGGFSPAGRFLVPLVPLFCLAAVALVNVPTARYAAVMLLIPQILIAAYGWQHPRALWPQGDGTNRVLAALLQPIGQPDRWLPSFRTDPQGAWTPAAALIALLAALNATMILASRTAPLERRG